MSWISYQPVQVDRKHRQIGSFGGDEVRLRLNLKTKKRERWSQAWKRKERGRGSWSVCLFNPFLWGQLSGHSGELGLPGVWASRATLTCDSRLSALFRPASWGGTPMMLQFSQAVPHSEAHHLPCALPRPFSRQRHLGRAEQGMMLQMHWVTVIIWWLPFIEWWLCPDAEHNALYTYALSLNPQSHPLSFVLLSFTFYRRGDWDSREITPRPPNLYVALLGGIQVTVNPEMPDVPPTAGLESSSTSPSQQRWAITRASRAWV